MVVSGSSLNTNSHKFTYVGDRILEGELEVSTSSKSTDVSTSEYVITWRLEETINT
jgi:hypothetical protein